MKPNETLAQDRVRHDETAPEIKAGGPRRIAAPAVHTRRADPVAALTRTIETQNRRLAVKMVSRTEAARRLAAAKANATHHLRATVDQRNDAARRGRADPLRGRVGGDQIGMGLFELHQLGKELVVLKIPDHGPVENVVVVVMLADQGPQLV